MQLRFHATLLKVSGVAENCRRHMKWMATSSMTMFMAIGRSSPWNMVLYTLFSASYSYLRF
jgi:hypothetical protein